MYHTDKHQFTAVSNFDLSVGYTAQIYAVRLPPGGRDALKKYACGIFLAKAGSKLYLRPGPKAGAVGD